MTPSYYPIQKRWRKLRPLFEVPAIIEIAHHEAECWRAVRAEDFGREFKPKPFYPEFRPAHYECCDWRWGNGRRGPEPHFWQWALAGACHWVATVNLLVISELEPDRPWRIATSQKHSTVIDSDRQLMFDTNFLALGVSAQECWEMAVESEDSELLRVGEPMFHQLFDGEE